MIFMLTFLPLWLGVVLYALRYGGLPERLAALGQLVAYPLSIAMYRWGPVFAETLVGEMLVDVLLLAVLMAIALRADRLWPIAMASMQTLAVAGHAIRIADPDLPYVLYWFTKTVWAYPMLMLLLVATVHHRNRTKRNGIEPSWRSY